jgi:hypothetical protein
MCTLATCWIQYPYIGAIDTGFRVEWLISAFVMRRPEIACMFIYDQLCDFILFILNKKSTV